MCEVPPISLKSPSRAAHFDAVDSPTGSDLISQLQARNLSSKVTGNLAIPVPPNFLTEANQTVSAGRWHVSPGYHIVGLRAVTLKGQMCENKGLICRACIGAIGTGFLRNETARAYV